MKLFLDSDGVFAGFDQHVFNLFGKYPHQMRDPEMWAKINANPDFWSDMPIIDGSRVLWDALKKYNPTVLTGCPKSNYDAAAAHKVVWWREHFDHNDVITCLSRDKATHMVFPGDILVDDMIKNCRRWEAAGGVAIHYKGDVEDTIAKVEALMATASEQADERR
jgi:hypothetical protein